MWRLVVHVDKKEEPIMRYRLIAERKKAGFSQRELAELIGVAPSTIGAYENGDRNPRGTVAKRLSKLFRVPEEILFKKGRG